MKFTKGMIAALVASSLALGACGVAQQTQPAAEPAAPEPIDLTVSRYGDASKASTSPVHDALVQTITTAAEESIQIGGDYFILYRGTEWPSRADSFPATFDLRDRGVIAPVKSQYPWGTCWSFATIAASEASILSSMNTTVEGYEQAAGEPLDLSEKHLAYFTLNHLPAVSEYPDGDYPWDASQQGEGLHSLVEETIGKNAPYNTGGTGTESGWALAAGIGVVPESMFPYESAEGGVTNDGDWSIPEENRFAQQYAVKDVHVLPVPGRVDADGVYTYNPAGTEAMKGELLAGRPIMLAYAADVSMPQPTEEELPETVEVYTELYPESSADDMLAFLRLRYGYLDESEVSDEQMRRLVDVRLQINGMDANLYDTASMTREQMLAALRTSNHFGEPAEGLVEAVAEELDTHVYMNFGGPDQSLFCQYTYEPAEANHAVAVIGWDDNFPKENFREDHQPPEDGAWIVRNSWGEEYGTEGYFYLSYYDQSIVSDMSYEFVMDGQDSETAHAYVMEYDYLPAQIYTSTLSEKPIYAANVFTAEGDCVLEYVSALTGERDTDITVSVYALKDGATAPTDGMLVDSTSESFAYAGYHRINLTRNVALKEGERVGIVVVERVPTADGTKYALVNTSAPSYAAIDVYNEAHAGGSTSRDYSLGVVNQGESFVAYDGTWVDWADEVADIAEKHELCDLLAYDNLPIKGYAYPLDEVRAAHEFDATVEVPGGEASVCSDCGFVLTDVSE